MPTSLPKAISFVRRDETRVSRGSTIAIAILVTWAAAMLLFGTVARWGDPTADPFDSVVAF